MNSPATSDSSSSSGSAYSSWTPSNSSSSSPVHPASLVDPSTHSPELMQLLDIDISRPVVEYVVSSVQETVDHAFRRPSGSRSPRSHKFTNFVSNVLSRAEVAPATLLVALVYIARSRAHISIALEQWALERVFLGALVVASKYTQDSTLRNVHWALVTGLFSKADVGRVEREFLEVLDWELRVTEDDLLAHREGLVGASSGSGVSPSWARVAAKEEDAVHDLAVHSPTSAPLPELEPSSTHSSAGSLSPRTPSHMDIDPPAYSPVSHSPTMAVDLHALSAPPPTPAPAATQPSPAPKKSARHGHGHGHTRSKLRQLLHAFHYPHHHQHAVEVAA